MSEKARLCTAKSKRTGERCRQVVYKKPDGTYTTTCRSHSGGHQLRAKGDPRNGGQPPKTYSYSKLLPKRYQSTYGLALTEVGKLDQEIALARTNFYRFVESQKAERTVSDEDHERIMGEHLDRIARLEVRRAQVIAIKPPESAPPAIRFITGAADEISVEEAIQSAIDKRDSDGDV